MLELQTEYDYITVDTDEWVGDRVSEVNEEATEAFEAFASDSYEDRFVSHRLLSWLGALGATGLYGDNEPNQTCTVNEETYLSDDFILTFAHTEEYGTLYCVQDGYMSDSPVTIYSFNGDDDADAFGWATGGASCSDPECESEYNLESACQLYDQGRSEGGGQRSYNIADDVIIRDEDGDYIPTCPRCGKVGITFWAY